MTYEIRRMTEEDSRLAWEWSVREGWNPGRHDRRMMTAIDPAGCFAGILDGEMVSSITAVSYQGKYGFLGMYMVSPGHRGRGYGLAIWERALHYLRGEVGVDCTGLDGALAYAPLYRSSGFSASYRICSYRLSVDQLFQRACPAVERRHFDDILAYDLKVFKVGRASFLSDLLFNVEAVTAAAFSGGRLTGFAAARPCQNGYKLGPLFADDAGIAATLLESLLADLPGETVFIEAPEPNIESVEMVTGYGAEPGSVTERMYSGDGYHQDIRYVYGNTTRTVG
ncbi:MAG: GNAT family N-acetyltransferase [Chloroflexi bacterium]|nr:GNAT family N-acetyltransferase [Chloroflexota bacterium]